MMEFVGRILDIGSSVSDSHARNSRLRLWTAEAGSHLFGKREEFALTAIAEDDDAIPGKPNKKCNTRNCIGERTQRRSSTDGIVELSALGVELANELGKMWCQHHLDCEFR